MKRSEMVDLMFKFISETIEYDYDMYMDRDDTDKLLTKMEEIGILPPSALTIKPGPCPGFKMEGTLNSMFCCTNHFYYPNGISANQWEKE